MAHDLDQFQKFCEKLPADTGKPLGLHPYQRKMLGNYFDGTRETLVLIPKKNGKSTMLAAVALFRLVEQLDVSIAIVASSRDQAMILFEQARGFIDRSKPLQKKLRVLRGYREIRRRDPEFPDSPKLMRGMIKVYAADADTADGWLGDLVLVDELHRHKSIELYSVLRDGLGPRGGQMITISTAGDTDDSPLGMLRARAYEHEVQRDGAYRYMKAGGFCLHEWALDADEDRESLELVKTANPAPWMTMELLQERRDSPSMTQAHWARFACGVWGLGGEPAFDRDVWDSLAVEQGQPAKGAKVALGFDGSLGGDGTALVGCDVETGHLFTLGYWQRPIGAGEEWEVPQSEVDQAVAYAFERWKVFALYADPAWWQDSLDRWAGDHGETRIVKWWTNHIKKTAIALREFHASMEPGKMSHPGDALLTDHIRNAIQHDTRMLDNEQPLWVIRKDSQKSLRKIDLAMAAMLAWTARGDAIAKGFLKERQYARAAW